MMVPYAPLSSGRARSPYSRTSISQASLAGTALARPLTCAPAPGNAAAGSATTSASASASTAAGASAAASSACVLLPAPRSRSDLARSTLVAAAPWPAHHGSLCCVTDAAAFANSASGASATASASAAAAAAAAASFSVASFSVAAAAASAAAAAASFSFASFSVAAAAASASAPAAASASVAAASSAAASAAAGTRWSSPPSTCGVFWLASSFCRVGSPGGGFALVGNGCRCAMLGKSGWGAIFITRKLAPLMSTWLNRLRRAPLRSSAVHSSTRVACAAASAAHCSLRLRVFWGSVRAASRADVSMMVSFTCARAPGTIWTSTTMGVTWVRWVISPSRMRPIGRRVLDHASPRNVWRWCLPMNTSGFRTMRFPRQSQRARTRSGPKHEEHYHEFPRQSSTQRVPARSAKQAHGVRFGG